MTAVDFYVIGAQKAGTTWLYNRLLEVEGFCMPRVKEVHFFDSVSDSSPFANRSYFDRSFLSQLNASPSKALRSLKPVFYNFLKGNLWETKYHLLWNFRKPNDRWYAQYMRHHQKKGLAGDLTPRHAILNLEDVKRMQAVGSRAKLLYCLRDPMEQIWSHWRMGVKVNKLDSGAALNTEAFEAFINKPMVLQHVKYIENAEKFETVFGHKPRLFFYDDLIHNPQDYFKNIIHYLGIPKDADLTKVNFSAQNLKGQSLKMSEPMQELLKKTLKPIMQKMAETEGGAFAKWHAKHF
jgi:hypothetical protein